VSGGKIFVGRKAELVQFKNVIEDPRGQAIVVVGHRGMGKTWLVNKMAELAENHPNLKCGYVRYEVTPTDSVDSTMALMMDNAFEAAKTEPGSFDAVPQRKKQWLALIKTLVPKGGELTELIGALRRDSARNTREQFLERLQLISKRMPENGRAIFIIDPEKRMQKESDYAWGIVISRLPSKVKFLFAQRLEDELVCGEGLERCNNVVRIPEGELSRFDNETADELVEITMCEKVGVSDEVKVQIRNSDRKPYTIGGAASLLAHTTIQLKELAKYLTEEEVVGAQWRGVCSKGKEAKRLFEAYAILEVGVPDEVVTAVSELDTDTLQSIFADNFLGGLLREEGYGKRIYHSILADCILQQIEEKKKKEYHIRCEAIYRKRLTIHNKPDALSANQLAMHIKSGRGRDAFVEFFLDELHDALQKLGWRDYADVLATEAFGIGSYDPSKEERLRKIGIPATLRFFSSLCKQKK
jgi:energy-coupling factor transporter ATP-binding protein EcfA2